VAAQKLLVDKLRAFLPLASELVIPVVGYFVLHAIGLSDVWALTGAGLLTGAHAFWATIRRGRIDGIGVLIVCELALTVVLLVVSDDPRWVLLKPSFYTAAAAIYLYVSCFVGRPVVYEAATPLATDGDPQRLEAYHAAWENSAPFRSRERAITAVFGTALLIEAVLRGVVVFSLPVDRVGESVLAGSAPGAVLIIAALVYTKMQVPMLQRVVDAEQARLADASNSSPDAAPLPSVELPTARTASAPVMDPKLS
jgi:hypothetical protein